MFARHVVEKTEDRNIRVNHKSSIIGMDSGAGSTLGLNLAEPVSKVADGRGMSLYEYAGGRGSWSWSWS